MEPFQEARKHFAQAASTVTGKEIRIEAVMPEREDVIRTTTELYRTGSLLAFMAYLDNNVVRGFANAHGEALVRWGPRSIGDVGILFREADALTTPPTLDAMAIAARIVWLLGEEYELTENQECLELGVRASPALVRTPGGGVRLTLHAYRTSVPGGSTWQYEVVVDCSAEYQATIQLAKDLSTPIG